jgi:hypothetical protein
MRLTFGPDVERFPFAPGSKDHDMLVREAAASSTSSANRSNQFRAAPHQYRYIKRMRPLYM